MLSPAENENQGATPIEDRAQEHLASTDVAIVRMRRKLLAELSQFQGGAEPRAALDGALCHVRPITASLEDNGTPCYEDARDPIFV
jgi:hypothetical protein